MRSSGDVRPHPNEPISLRAAWKNPATKSALRRVYLISLSEEERGHSQPLSAYANISFDKARARLSFVHARYAVPDSLSLALHCQRRAREEDPLFFAGILYTIAA